MAAHMHAMRSSSLPRAAQRHAMKLQQPPARDAPLSIDERAPSRVLEGSCPPTLPARGRFSRSAALEAAELSQPRPCGQFQRSWRRVATPRGCRPRFAAMAGHSLRFFGVAAAVWASSLALSEAETISAEVGPQGTARFRRLVMHHDHAHGDHRPPHEHGPPRSSSKYGCIHHKLLESGPRNQTPPSPQVYEISGPRRLAGEETGYASMRFYLDTTRLYPGK